MWNRSVPTDAALPHLTYRNLAEAIEWLTSTFGFAEHYRYGEPVSGAQIILGKAVIMLKSARGGATNPACVTVFLDNVDAHYAHTQAAGAKIFEEIQETCYGERQYGVEDLEGHRWLFSQHVRDLSPADWGAEIRTSAPQA
jgi:uncharacterized glyoxalase superfamily protein PhnB